MNTTKPFLKWVGGKTQILEDVLFLFPARMRNYYEPFLGGGSVLLGLLSSVKAGSRSITGRIYASDINQHLIGLYRNIQSQPRSLIAEVKTLVSEFRSTTGTEVNRKAETHAEAMSSPESYYFWIRTQFNALPVDDRMSVRASAMFLFLNKTCFRGIYREGPSGFNVPFGNYKHPTILDEDHILSVSELIKDVTFRVSTFDEALTTVGADDFVYADPPYAPETDTSFVSYTSDGFSLEQHNRLFALCDTLRARGARLVMSNADVKLVRDAFAAPTYATKVISCRRAINSKKPDSKANEVLITNQPAM